MIAHIWQWISQNQFIWGIISTLIATILGLIIVPAKFIKLGFTVSQWIRHLLGAKAEKEFEEAIDAFDQGLHSDDQK
jgi:hypothetical protein